MALAIVSLSRIVTIDGFDKSEATGDKFDTCFGNGILFVVNIYFYNSES